MSGDEEAVNPAAIGSPTGEDGHMRRTLLRRAITATVALAFVVSACSSGDGGRSAGPATTGEPAGPAVLPTTVFDPNASVAEEPGPAAATPEAAISQFVSGEVAGDARAAWSIMSAADRKRYPTADMWRSERAQLPRLLAAELDGRQPVADGDGRMELVAPVTFQPALDPVNGLVPSRAEATWVVLNEDGGWRLSYGQTVFTPRFEPGSDANVSAAAVAWADERRRCDPGADGTYEHEVTGGVVGVAGAADRLCGTTGAITAGAVERLSGPEAGSVIAAFGPEAVAWARVVTLEAPVPMRVVLGPLGSSWIAVGILPS
jgi:hypothetical protein